MGVSKRRKRTRGNPRDAAWAEDRAWRGELASVADEIEGAWPLAAWQLRHYPRATSRRVTLGG